MEVQLIETWSIHDRINRYLLAAVSPAGLEATAAGKGRTVGEQFAHLHNVRLLWLGSAAPELLTGLEKIEKAARPDRALLERSLAASSAAIVELLRRGFASGTSGGRIKGFKPHAAAFLGYLIAHESHHRGQIVLILKLAGHPVDKKTAYGLWEWGVR
jgi:uncharacterized damage-inducible protein DinB